MLEFVVHTKVHGINTFGYISHKVLCCLCSCVLIMASDVEGEGVREERYRRRREYDSLRREREAGVEKDVML